MGKILLSGGGIFKLAQQKHLTGKISDLEIETDCTHKKTIPEGMFWTFTLHISSLVEPQV